MSELEKYLVGASFLSATGFFNGHAWATFNLYQQGELSQEVTLSRISMGLASVLLLAGYTFAWGSYTDGPRFVWVPAAVLWFVFSSIGGFFARQNFAALVPWRTPFIGAITLAACFHSFKFFLGR